VCRGELGAAPYSVWSCSRKLWRPSRAGIPSVNRVGTGSAMNVGLSYWPAKPRCALPHAPRCVCTGSPKAERFFSTKSGRIPPCRWEEQTRFSSAGVAAASGEYTPRLARWVCGVWRAGESVFEVKTTCAYCRVAEQQGSADFEFFFSRACSGRRTCSSDPASTVVPFAASAGCPWRWGCG